MYLSRMLENQKHLFSLDESTTYINGAYMSPQLKSVEQAGMKALIRKNQPTTISQNDFFGDRKVVKERFAQLIEAPDYRNCAIVPSVSYGIATVAKNIHLQAGDEILIVDEQFPSNVYAWREKVKTSNAIIKIVAAPETVSGRGELWNKQILEAINSKTKVVAMGHIHWADGTLFDLVTIRKKAHSVGAKLIIDGTQSVGALPFSVSDIQPDALVCGGYKWLMGPYSIGMAYYADTFLDGEPLEYNWISRKNSEDFSQLVNYQDDYQPKADRFSVGESSNFILLPMQIAAIDQLLTWGTQAIQEYTQHISTETIAVLRAKGCFIEEEAYRAKHLFGVYPPDNMDMEVLKKRFHQNGISVGIRGKAIRVSPHVYNTIEDFQKLIACFD